MTRFFITGGAGFIGSHLVDRLIKNKNHVVVYDNLSSGDKKFLAKHFKENLKFFKFIEGDVLDLPLLSGSLTGIDFVFHLSANPDIRHGIEHTDWDLKQNTLATYNVLEAMRVNGVKKIAFSSSSVVYGNATLLPTPENYGPMVPASLYGASKLAGEGLITAFCRTFGFQSWIFRFANVVGGRSTHGVFYDFFHKLKQNPSRLEILGDGKQAKSYLFVLDCIDAMLYCIENAKDDINIYNIGPRDQLSVLRIAELILNALELSSTKIEFTGGSVGWAGDVPQMSLDPSRIEKLGWECPRTSEQAARDAIEVLKREIWDAK